MANTSILAAFERMWQHIVAAFASKTDVANLSDSLDVALDEFSSHTHQANFGVRTSGTGTAYTATVEGITTLTTGVSFTMIPNVVSASNAPTLNVNGLGAKTIRRRVSSATTSTTTGYAVAWLAANKPIKVEYDGTFWIADLPAQNASDLYGTVPISKGGTGATTAAAALQNLGVTYNITDLTAGTSALTTGSIYLMYE